MHKMTKYEFLEKYFLCTEVQKHFRDLKLFICYIITHIYLNLARNGPILIRQIRHKTSTESPIEQCTLF